jgi:hypothetical protein
MDCNPGSHRPLEVQQPSSGQFPFTGLECDFFQLGGFQVQMAADHAAKSQRQRRGGGIDEADCSSLRHYSRNDRRKWMDAQHWRSAFSVRREQGWRGLPVGSRRNAGAGRYRRPRRSLGDWDQIVGSAKDARSNRATSASKSTFVHVSSTVRNAASVSAWIIFGLMALALSSCAGLSSTPGEPAHNRCSTPGSGDRE